jgi:hypothetical protein
MIYKKLQIILSIAFATTLNAQDVFKVLASKGTVTVKTGNSVEWKKPFVGTKIQQTDAIKLNANDYLGLMHIASGKTLELKTAGSYNAKELANKVASTGSSYSQKYAEYVMSAMSNNGADANKNVGGVVYRGLYDIDLDYPVDQQVVVSSRVFEITWHKKPEMSPYKLTVQNMFDEVVFTTVTPDTTIKIDLTKVELGDDVRLKVFVEPSEPTKIMKGKKDIGVIINESKDFAKRKQEFLSEVTDETALNYLIKAKFYESNNMFLDAVDSYNKAIKLEPNIEAFQKLKEDYLILSHAKTPPNEKK